MKQKTYNFLFEFLEASAATIYINGRIFYYQNYTQINYS